MQKITSFHHAVLCRLVLGAALVAGLAGCAAGGMLAPGATIESARHGAIAPNAEYALPGGGTRLEFAHGGYSRVTYMLDFDAGGRLVSQQQVLTDANFAKIVPGMPQAEVNFNIGKPTEVFGAGWVESYRVWNYRFVGGECLVFQVSISDRDHRVISAGVATDMACGNGDSKE